MTTYIDDLLIHSPDVKTHLDHLRQVFQRLKEACLTLRGRKCHIGLSQVHYLGHVFTNQVVFALKQFRHYLLGKKFKLVTDHAPLQWLSAQKMEGMLCRWALAMQEFTFDISYRNGSLNGNADALSRRATGRNPEVEDTTAITANGTLP